MAASDALTNATSAAFGIRFTVAAVSAGSLRTCGVTTGGAAYCWGHNDVGQFGDGTRTDSATPVRVAL